MVGNYLYIVELNQNLAGVVLLLQRLERRPGEALLLVDHLHLDVRHGVDVVLLVALFEEHPKSLQRTGWPASDSFLVASGHVNCELKA